MTSPEIVTTYYLSKIYSLRDAIGAVIEDLGLNGKLKDQRLGYSAKLTISYKRSLGQRKVCSSLQSDEFFCFELIDSNQKLPRWTDWFVFLLWTDWFVFCFELIDWTQILFALSVSLQMETLKKNPIASTVYYLYVPYCSRSSTLGMTMLTSYNQFFLKWIILLITSGVMTIFFIVNNFAVNHVQIGSSVG